MHRLLGRTKDKAAGDDQPVAKKTKKGKKAPEEEVKPDFDLSSALPAVNDFRTSLIMPGLSTRFSMLREQDDPNSKIGKASDDSVLQSTQSHTQDFGFSAGLSDIAEVSSLHSSIRPPFANEGRPGSFDSESIGEESGSIMTRARPGEGNVLFGGRQKIYVVSNNSSKGLGRTLYDDDINMSAYQRLRAEEKERLRQEAEELNNQYFEPSSPTALSQKRETSSSTNSGPTNVRTSTAATSIASQGTGAVSGSSPAIPSSSGQFSPTEVGRSTAKPRRLYDQGLDQHFQDQQSSAMSRLNSIQRTHTPTGRSTPPIPLSQTRSTTSLSDRFHRGPTSRSDSPSTTGHPGVLRNNSQLSSAGSSPVISQTQSPVLGSPVLSDYDENQALSAALQPHDRGKATAMGAFNKPKEAFSEQQYAERMKRMQQEREVKEAPVPKVENSPPQSPPRKPTLRERADQERRKRAESDAARKKSAEASQAPPAFSVFQAAANQMKATNHTLQSPPPTQAGPTSPSAESSASNNGNTFLASQSSSDDESAQPRPATARTEAGRRFDNLPVATGPAPSIFEHPAMRSRTPSDEKVPQLSSQPTVPQFASERPQHPSDPCNEVDSPTLGPNGGGLSGLIRQHLRSDSNVSSNFDESDAKPVGLAIQTQSVARGRQPASNSATPAPSTHSHSNPWDLDDLNSPYRDDQGSINSSVSAEGQKRTPLTAAALGSQWENNPKRTHERVASNETEAEHEAFQRDLAYRQRLIQENLRARAEGRSLSPAPGGSGGLKNALNMLRAKSSRESFATVGERPQDGSLRGLRKMNLGASNNASTTSLSPSEHWKSEMPSLRNKTSRVWQQSEQEAPRSPIDGSTRTGRTVGRSAMSTRSSTRERSGSGTSSGRSLSRPDYYRGDVDNSMPSGGYSNNAAPPLPTDRPSLDSEGRTRSRSNSHFESKHLQPIQTGNSHPPLPIPSPNSKYPLSPRPSPGGPNGLGNSTFSSQPSPVPPFSANHTPPTSNPTTPNAAAFTPSSAQPFVRQGQLRKKSIAKSEISDPVFVSTTSVIDTVDLPPGASLKNGAEPFVPPPVPPINPMRRRFGFGRSETTSPKETTSFPEFDAPQPPYAEPTRTHSSDGRSSQDVPVQKPRKSISEGRSLHGKAQAQAGAAPAMPSGGYRGRNTSAPRPMNEHSPPQRPMDGTMF
jgi:hypothetical protein